MTTLFLDNVSIKAPDGSDEVKSGITNCTIYYDVLTTDLQQNPVTVTAYVRSDLKVAIDPASWQKTMLISENSNTYTQIVAIHVNEFVTDPVPIRVSLTVKDQSGHTVQKETSFTIIP